MESIPHEVGTVKLAAPVAPQIRNLRSTELIKMRLWTGA